MLLSGKEKGTIRVWVFYKGKDICGITSFKELKDRFKIERPQCKMKTFYMNDKQFKAFTLMYQDCWLFQNVMDDGKIEIHPVTTYKENDKLESFLDKLNYEIESLIHELDNYPLKPKVKKKLLEALDYLDEEGNFKLDIIRIYIRYIANYDI